MLHLTALERQLAQEKDERVKSERKAVELGEQAALLKFDLDNTSSSLSRMTELKEQAEQEVCSIAELRFK